MAPIDCGAAINKLNNAVWPAPPLRKGGSAAAQDGGQIMLRSLYSGVTGLKAQQTALDVIGNNLANMSTIGFRAARTTFSDILNQTVRGAVGSSGERGGINAVQVGLGVKANSIDTIGTAGQLQVTNRLMDLAIQGAGFFTLSDGNGGKFYTRAGAFGFDEGGYITNPGNGYRAMGLNADAQGTIDPTRPPESVHVDFTSISEAKVTKNINFTGNLDSKTTGTPAQTSNRFLTTFNEYGLPLGGVAGDTLRITGFEYDDITTPGTDTPFANYGAAGDVMTLSNTTTVNEVAEALKAKLRALTGSTTLDVGFEGGQFTINCANETISKLNISAFSVDGAERTNVRRIFTQPGTSASGLSGSTDVAANSQTKTRLIRQADNTTSIDTYDSQGNPRTVVTTWAKNTENVLASSGTALTALRDLDGNALGITVGSQLALMNGTFTDADGNAVGTNLSAEPVLDIAANTTMSDVAAWLQARLRNASLAADITVSLRENGSLEISSPTVNINDMIVGYDADGAGGGTPVANGVISRAFNTNGYGIPDAATNIGLDVPRAAATLTNSFHTDGAINNAFNYQVLVPNDIRFPPDNTTGQLIFKSDGSFYSYGFDRNGATLRTDPVLTFDPDGTDPYNNGVDALSITLDMQSLAQTSAVTTAAATSQDGSPIGQLESVTVGEDGLIKGVFTNGTTRTMAQLVLTTFPNEGGLMRHGDTMFVESSNSGEPNIGNPMTQARGKIISGALEMSNVDVAEQFTQLIVAQRAFQANARTITVGDEVLLEVVNLKR